MITAARSLLSKYIIQRNYLQSNKRHESLVQHLVATCERIKCRDELKHKILWRSHNSGFLFHLSNQLHTYYKDYCGKIILNSNWVKKFEENFKITCACFAEPANTRRAAYTIRPSPFQFSRCCHSNEPNEGRHFVKTSDERRKLFQNGTRLLWNSRPYKERYWCWYQKSVSLKRCL